MKWVVLAVSVGLLYLSVWLSGYSDLWWVHLSGVVLFVIAIFAAGVSLGAIAADSLNGR